MREIGERASRAVDIKRAERGLDSERAKPSQNEMNTPAGSLVRIDNTQ